MSGENTWIDYSNASIWEENISKLDAIFNEFNIGTHTSNNRDEIKHIDTPFEFDSLHYIVSYYFSAFDCVWDDQHTHWPIYMIEMMQHSNPELTKQSTIYETYHISEFIYIHLESKDLKSYIDDNQSKKLLSSAQVAMRLQEYPIPIFVEGSPKELPLIGSVTPKLGQIGCSTHFRSNFFHSTPSYCKDIKNSVSHFCALASCDASEVSLSRIYTWVWFPSIQNKFWRFHLQDKETIKHENPTLFILQGFISINLWGAPNNPLELLQIRCMMNRIPYNKLSDFDPLQAASFQVDASLKPINELPLSQMCGRLMNCFVEAQGLGEEKVLYEIGLRYYNELIEEQSRNKNSGSKMISNMMDYIKGSRTLSVEGLVDSIKCIFKKGIQIQNDGSFVESVQHSDFTPREFLSPKFAPIDPSTSKEDEFGDVKIEMRERIVEVPVNGELRYYRIPASDGSIHIPRASLPNDAYPFITHSAPVSSLVSIISLRCAEILEDRYVDTLGLFWYLLIDVIGYHHENGQILPHLGTLIDNTSNICTLRPPLPSLQYNLLHQKLLLLNCCIEDRRNNSFDDDDYDRSSSSSSQLYFSDDEEHTEDDNGIRDVDGRGVLNWSGWYLDQTSEPCWVPLTRDKDILTEDKVHLQQEALAQTREHVNEIRDEFKATVIDDIQSFKAANPKANFIDFVRWHSPRDYVRVEGEENHGVLSSRMSGQNPLRLLFDSASKIPAADQKKLFNARIEGESTMDFLKTCSPIMVMSNLLVPFLGASCYIFDSLDDKYKQVPMFVKTLNDFKEAVKEVSNTLDEQRDLSSETMSRCLCALKQTEYIATICSSLLSLTKGNATLVGELIEKDYHVELDEGRKVFIELIQDRLARAAADECIYKLYAESSVNSESSKLNKSVMKVAQRMVVDKNDERTILFTALSSCDIYKQDD